MKKFALLLLCIAFLGMHIVNAQVRRVSGTVTGAADNAPIPGVSVSVKGTTLGTITDNDGKYSLDVPNDVTSLVFSFIGMKSLEAPITGSTLDVVLESDLQEIGEIVAIGYGVKRKGSITGSVGTVEAEKMEQVPVVSFDNALQGQVAGLTVTSSSGRPGAATTVRIRGISSINAGNNPLYIMDGIEISAGEFYNLNQNDIEQISVLKDASAASIYGSRAANGVVIITTKRGKTNEETEVTFRAMSGISILKDEKIDFMTTKEKLDYEEYLGIRTAGNYDRAALEKVNTDWKNELFSDAPMQSYEMSFRGGSPKTRFFISGNYLNVDGILDRSSFERFGGRLNLDHNISDKFKIGTSLSIGYSTQNLSVSADEGYRNNIYNPGFVVYLLNPYLPMYREDGSFATKDDGLPWSNPKQQLELNEESQNELKIVNSTFAEMELYKDLKFKTVIGGDFTDFTDFSYLHPESAWGNTSNGEVGRMFIREFRLTNSNTLNYEFTLQDSHNFNALLGQESIRYTYEDFDVEGRGLPNNIVKQIDTAAEKGDIGGIKAEYSILSYFGTLSYDYNEKYYLDLSYRTDGSSRFGEDNRWGKFWSTGLRWDAMQEDFMSGVDFISALSLKANVGTSGNNRIGNYRHLALYSYSGVYNDENASFPSEPGNRNLTWEKSLVKNVGVSLSLVDRFDIDIDAYHRTTSDMLFEVPLSYTTGFASGWDNVGEMVNKGVELTFKGDVIRWNDFTWNLDFNVSYNNNEVTELTGDPNDPDDPDNEIIDGSIITKVGESLGSFYMVRFAGVNPANGQALWYTKDGEITNKFSDSDAALLEKSWYAPWAGGFTNTFSYKGFQISAFFSWMKDKYMLNNNRYFIESHGQFAAYQQSAALLDYWKQPGDLTDIPKPDGNNYFDSRLVEDASFLRLKTLIVSYDFPERLLKKTKLIKKLKVYGQGYNVLTFTKYKGFDPEFYGSSELGMYPQVRTFTVGVDVGF